MDNSTYVALSLAQAMRRDLDVTTNNIANADTAGFKGEHIVFNNYVHRPEDTADGQDISFVIEDGSYLDNRQGPIEQTGNPLDVAVLGEGWLSYRTPDGQTAFGRDGRFTIDAEGNLITLNGSSVLDAGGGEIAIPQDAGDITIARDGTISTENNGVVGQLGLFDIADYQRLERIGGGLLVQPEGSGAPVLINSITSEIVQGSIEGSNVEPVTEMTRMIEIQRAYERAINLMSSEDDLRRDMLRRVGQTT